MSGFILSDVFYQLFYSISKSIEPVSIRLKV